MAVLETLSSGRLDKRVTVQSLGEASDGAGGQSRTWSDGVTVWAAIEQGAGREFMAAQELQPELSHIVTMRYRSTVGPKNRLKYVAGGVTRTFQVHAILDPLERHEQLQCYCSEIVPT